MAPSNQIYHASEPSSAPQEALGGPLTPFSPQEGEENNSSYLDNLDMSLIGSPDFDMSCIMDIDEPGDAMPETVPGMSNEPESI
jgi:hypothetical protein